jgi:type II secretory pathway pseudopilin PulG
MRKYFKNKLHISTFQTGFTLIELLLYMGIFTILLTVFIQMFGHLMDTQIESNTTSGISYDAKYIPARLTYDIRLAESITSPSIGISGPSLQFVENSIPVSYALTGSNLTITNGSGTDQLNGSDTSVSNLSFTPLGSVNGKLTVKISFTLTSKTVRRGNNFLTENIQTTVGLR